ncbi:MAG: thioredoxin domain-containing protein [Burkholderiales bacterium]
MNIRVVVLAAAAGVLVTTSVVLAAITWESGKPAAPAVTAGDRASALSRAYAPTRGNPDAKVAIVEFIDPACETCREFYPFVKDMVKNNPDKIRLSLRHVPLHAGSDQVIRMLEAAKKQDKYWNALEQLLALQSSWVSNHRVNADAALALLPHAGIDVERLKADMNAPEVAANMAQDAQDARTLKVTQTPEYFVNGKGMPEFGYEQLRGLVTDALASNYK